MLFAMVFITLLSIWVASVLIREEYYKLGFSCIIGGFLTILYLATLMPGAA